MKNINLKDRDISNKRKGKVGLTVTLSTILLIIVFSIYGVVFGLNMMTKNSLAQVEQEIKAIKSTFASDEYKEVYKFGVKLIDLKEQIGNKGFLPLTEDIVKISKKTLPETNFAVLGAIVEDGVFKYTVELITPDKEVLAKQIRAYKEDENFKNVFLTGITSEADVLKAALNFDIGESKPQSTSKNQLIEENF